MLVILREVCHSIVAANWGMKLAILNIGLSVCSSLGYVLAGDYRRATYWICGAILTTTMTIRSQG